MIEKPYFVVLNSRRENIFIPMIDRYDNLIMFETAKEAIASGEANLLGQSCGFEVFEIGGGVY